MHLQSENFSKVAVPADTSSSWEPSPILGVRATEFCLAGAWSRASLCCCKSALPRGLGRSAALVWAHCWGVTLGVCLFLPTAHFSLGLSHCITGRFPEEGEWSALAEVGVWGVADGNMNELLKDLVRAQGRCISPGLVAGNALGPWAVGAGGGIPGES